MAVRIRLARRGRRHTPYYRMVVADSRFPRDGRFIEILGTYQPVNKDESTQVKVDEEKAIKWLMQGAVPTDTVRSILRKQGILKKVHEMKQEAKKQNKEAQAAS